MNVKIRQELWPNSEFQREKVTKCYISPVCREVPVNGFFQIWHAAESRGRNDLQNFWQSI